MANVSLLPIESREIDKLKMRAELNKFSDRQSSLKLPIEAEKIFDNETTFLHRPDGDVILAASKNLNMIHFNWFSSSRILTDAEGLVLFEKLKAQAIRIYGNLPFGGVYTDACPYCREHGKDRIAQGIRTLSKLWVSDAVLFKKPEPVVKFPLEDNAGKIIGEKIFENVHLMYVPTGRFSIGVT